jgi:phosphatidylglycerophosphatase A
MPGTLGTLAALPLCYLLAQLRPGIALIATLGLVLAAIPIAERARKVFRGDDPGCIVIDEIAGMALTLLWLPPIPSVMAAAFVLFRMLDILKPWPIAWVDRHVRGGLGIVGDDVLAGAIANLTMRAALLLFGI